ncbi:hypothetical protein N6L24_00075 [Cognatishimia sp. SS12]|uniref:hypothetical protein n=1 Tax=Cognatishimia sp. SS12 TaxID=2979465 RepID=UPI00232F841C|nr:hypothetical protein [Cognatishimia sp. SS12]MDC0736662.1 hypothetical protein [Cognatishimia sp. SS12]
MTQVIIHIGTQKTGSTAIQSALFSNAEALEPLGYHFVKAGRRRAAHNHIAVSSRGPEIGALLDEVVAEIDAAPDKIHILSSEMFFRTSIAETLAAAFPDRLKDNIKFIAYVRRQDKFLEAMYKQLLKNGRFRGTPAEFVEKKQHSAAYTQVLDVFARHFGQAALSVKPFERRLFDGGDVVRDFLKELGVPEAASASWSYAHSNVTLSREASQILGQMSRNTDINTRQLIRFLARKRPEGAVRTGDCFQPSERRALMRLYREDNAQLKSKYCPQFDPMFDESDIAPGVPDEAPSREETAARREAALRAVMRALGKTHTSTVR